MTILFTIIYTIKIYSYLHDKRKADLYGALPISRITLYLSKSISALTFSLVPAYFFMGIIAIISIALGQPLVKESVGFFVNLFIGSFACVSAYGLIAICCGTTINSIIMFCAVCFIYPLSAEFIKCIATGFYYGLNLDSFSNSFVMNALNPIAAFHGNNVVYWIIFTAVCVVASCYLIKNRKAERAQSSFAYYLPCHLIKAMIAFVCGMFVGIILGALNVFGNALIGFAFGFAIVSSGAYIISHLIFHKGFSHILKSLIPLAGIIVVTIVGISFCCLDVTGYNKFVPDSEHILSAGAIDYNKCYCESNVDLNRLVNNSANDFSDSESIEDILEFHERYINNSDFHVDTKFQNLFVEFIISRVYTESPAYSVSYKMDNGQTISRIYKDTPLNDLSNIDEYNTLLSDIIKSETYFVNYSSFVNAKGNGIVNMSISNDNVEAIISSYDTSQANLNKVMNALRKDMELDDDLADNLQPYGNDCIESLSKYNENSENEYICFVWMDTEVSFAPQSELSITNLYSSMISYPNTCNEIIIVSSDYKNTISALKDIGVLESDLSINGYSHID